MNNNNNNRHHHPHPRARGRGIGCSLAARSGPFKDRALLAADGYIPHTAYMRGLDINTPGAMPPPPPTPTLHSTIPPFAPRLPLFQPRSRRFSLPLPAGPLRPRRRFPNRADFAACMRFRSRKKLPQKPTPPFDTVPSIPIPIAHHTMLPLQEIGLLAARNNTLEDLKSDLAVLIHISSSAHASSLFGESTASAYIPSPSNLMPAPGPGDSALPPWRRPIAPSPSPECLYRVVGNRLPVGRAA
jgi:hypothetical protein